MVEVIQEVITHPGRHPAVAQVAVLVGAVGVINLPLCEARFETSTEPSIVRTLQLSPAPDSNSSVQPIESSSNAGNERRVLIARVLVCLEDVVQELKDLLLVHRAS